VEKGVQTILTNSPTDDPKGYGLSGIDSVKCPDAATAKVEKGATFTCTLTENGAAKTVTITVEDGDGTYRVGAPH
jgi:hypothetical protein